MLLTQLIIPSYVTRTPCLENRQRPIDHLHPNINNLCVHLVCSLGNERGCRPKQKVGSPFD